MPQLHSVRLKHHLATLLQGSNRTNMYWHDVNFALWCVTSSCKLIDSLTNISALQHTAAKVNCNICSICLIIQDLLLNFSFYLSQETKAADSLKPNQHLPQPPGMKNTYCIKQVDMFTQIWIRRLAQHQSSTVTIAHACIDDSYDTGRTELKVTDWNPWCVSACACRQGTWQV